MWSLTTNRSWRPRSATLRLTEAISMRVSVFRFSSSIVALPAVAALPGGVQLGTLLGLLGAEQLVHELLEVLVVAPLAHLLADEVEGLLRWQGLGLLADRAHG